MAVAVARGTMRTPTGLAALAALAATIMGCAPPPPTSPPLVTAAATDAGAPRASAAAGDASAPRAPASTTVEGPPPPAARCHLTVTDTAGCQASQVETLVEPVRPQIEHCRGSSGGKLSVRVQQKPGGKLTFDLVPGTSLDPTEKKCVLDALNKLNGTDSATAWTGGSALPPTGFTSLLTIEW